MPVPDLPSRKLRSGVRGLSFTPGFRDIGPKGSWKKKRKDPDSGGVPAEPDRPNTLTGGAAAALDFEK
jgi:hypothetical protein